MILSCSMCPTRLWVHDEDRAWTEMRVGHGIIADTGRVEQLLQEVSRHG